MEKTTAKFTSADKGQTMIIEMKEGKSGKINIKASVKEGKGKGAPKAITGCRAQFTEDTKAQAYFDSLLADAAKAHWSRALGSSKNAFNKIPAPGMSFANQPMGRLNRKGK